MTPTDNDTLFSIEMKDLGKEMKAIYYKNGNGHVLTAGITRYYILFVAVLLILTVLFYFLSLSNHITWIVLFAMSGIVLLIFAPVAWSRIRSYVKWKAGADSVLQQANASATHILHVKEHAMEFETDTDTDIVRWKDVTNVKISSERIQISFPSNWYFIPVRSVPPEDYEKLKGFVRRKVNEGIREEV